MTHFVSTFQTAALTLSVVLFSQYLETVITFLPNTAYCYLICQSLDLLPHSMWRADKAT